MHSNIDSLDPGSDASNVDTELDFGGRLREARELKGITLNEIASATKHAKLRPQKSCEIANEGVTTFY